ncbi:hypothetical protein EW146_g1229 [Bondarzewia mesenterica]|uniref:Uncharacterized protein n=1 Tax=Bondarzewia mesenterica TaxID=1095465 RepID=A0A4S4M4Y6_9AGAM|nr:hypothetical protein EW146_g1229 [Bondarzewia mesenterica]
MCEDEEHDKLFREACSMSGDMGTKSTVGGKAHEGFSVPSHHLSLHRAKPPDPDPQRDLYSSSPGLMMMKRPIHLTVYQAYPPHQRGLRTSTPPHQKTDSSRFVHFNGRPSQVRQDHARDDLQTDMIAETNRKRRKLERDQRIADASQPGTSFVEFRGTNSHYLAQTRTPRIPPTSSLSQADVSHDLDLLYSSRRPFEANRTMNAPPGPPLSHTFETYGPGMMDGPALGTGGLGSRGPSQHGQMQHVPSGYPGPGMSGPRRQLPGPSGLHQEFTHNYEHEMMSPIHMSSGGPGAGNASVGSPKVNGWMGGSNGLSRSREPRRMTEEEYHREKEREEGLMDFERERARERYEREKAERDRDRERLMFMQQQQQQQQHHRNQPLSTSHQHIHVGPGQAPHHHHHFHHHYHHHPAATAPNGAPSRPISPLHSVHDSPRCFSGKMVVDIPFQTQKVIEINTHEAQRLGLLHPLIRQEIEHFADLDLSPSSSRIIPCAVFPATTSIASRLLLRSRRSKSSKAGAHHHPQPRLLRVDLQGGVGDARRSSRGFRAQLGRGSGLRGPRIDKKDGQEEDQYNAMGKG